jgi:hypothetical protein
MRGERREERGERRELLFAARAGFDASLLSPL